MSDSRTQFERAFMAIYDAAPAICKRDEQGFYLHPELSIGWTIWQACEAQKDAEIASLKDSLALARSAITDLTTGGQ